MNIINLWQNSINGVCVAGCFWADCFILRRVGSTTVMTNLGEMRLSGTIAVNGTFSASIVAFILAVTHHTSNAAVTASI